MKTRRIHSLLTLLLLSTLTLGVFSGCTESVEYEDTRTEEEQKAKPQALNTQVFATAQDLKAWRAEGAVILDTRSAEDFAAGHIKGALPTKSGKEFQDELGLVFPDVVKLQETARAMGLKKDQKILIYGNAANSGSGRLFWTLEYLGHGQVYLLADGYDAILSELGEEAETGEVTPEPGDFVVALREEIVATAEEVRQVANGEREAILIDTRREGEYEGTEDRGDPRQGYIPKASWYYWENVFDAETKALRDKEELRAEFSSLGLLKDEAFIIPYCQTGVRSAYVYAVFRWLGHKNVKNYDGSWAEWSRDEGLPVAQVETKN